MSSDDIYGAVERINALNDNKKKNDIEKKQDKDRYLKKKKTRALKKKGCDIRNFHAGVLSL